MASTFVSAGVFIQEKNDSLHVPALSPAIMGVVGTATKGPLDQATLVTSEGQLVDIFGVPRSKDFGMQTAIEALKASRLVFFVRIAGPSNAAGFVDVNDAGSGATQACIGPSANGAPFNLVGGSTESPVGTRTTQIDINYDNGAGAQNVQAIFTAVQADVDNSPGAATYDLNGIDSGNPVFLTLQVDGGPIQTIAFASTDPLISNFAAVTPAEVTAVINDQIIGGEARFTSNVVTIASDRFGSGSSVQVTGGNANTVFSFPTTLQAGSGNVSNLSAVTALEVQTIVVAAATVGGDLVVNIGTSQEVTICTGTTGSTKDIELVSATSPALGAAPLINLTPLDSVVAGTDATASAPTVRFSGKTVGSHSSDIEVRVAASTNVVGAVNLRVFSRQVLVETFTDLAKSPSPPAGALDLITVVNDGAGDGSQAASEFVTASDLNATGENPAVGSFALTAGDNGDDWTPGTVIGTDVAGVQTGMQIFRNPERIDINLLVTPGISYAAVISEGIDIALSRADTLYVADSPQGLTPQEVVQWHNGDASIGAVIVDQELRTETNSTQFNSSYAALYYPFVRIFDKFNPLGGADGDGQILVPPSGIVLRTIAFTDQVAEPWFAPAGAARSQTTSVLDLELSPSLGERDLMQLPGNAVNPIANISGVGVTIMGQKTLSRAPSALDRVNVRRLLLLAEKVVARAVFFLVFEQNDEVMWRRFINLVSPLFEDIKARRGLFDFRVIADNTTTTNLDIDQNTFRGKIFLQPVKSAEKLIVSFNLVPTGANFEEFRQP